jgi:hypothetical protein
MEAGSRSSALAGKMPKPIAAGPAFFSGGYEVTITPINQLAVRAAVQV